MLKANERRQKILEILCVRRQETMENLAQEFNVTIRTIRNDIEELTLAHPLKPCVADMVEASGLPMAIILDVSI